LIWDASFIVDARGSARRYGAILANELSKPRYEGWRLSHALIHTRVFGQAAAVGSLVLVFGFKDALRKMGAPFEI